MTDDLSRVLADIDSLLPPGAPTTPDGVIENWEWDAMRWEPVDHDHHPQTVRRSPRLASADDWARSASDGHAAFSYAMGGWAAPSEAVYDLDRDWPSLIPPQFRRHRLAELADPDLEHGGDLASSGHPQQTAQAFLPARGEFDPPRPLPAGYEVRATTPNDHHHVYWPAVWWIGPALRATEYAAALDNLTREAQRTATNLQHLRARWDRHGQAQAVIEARRNRNTGPTDPNGLDGRARRHEHPRRSAARNASPATHGAATPVLVTWRDGALALGFDPVWR